MPTWWPRMSSWTCGLFPWWSWLRFSAGWNWEQQDLRSVKTVSSSQALVSWGISHNWSWRLEYLSSNQSFAVKITENGLGLWCWFSAKDPSYAVFGLWVDSVLGFFSSSGKWRGFVMGFMMGFSSHEESLSFWSTWYLREKEREIKCESWSDGWAWRGGYLVTEARSKVNPCPEKEPKGGATGSLRGRVRATGEK